jgi:leucyl-tRNA synthetase
MILLNHAFDLHAQTGELPRKVVEVFTLLLAPFAPHVSEEVWQRLGNKESLTHAAWPSFEEAKTKASEFELPIQINGKLRDKVVVDTGIDEATLKEMVLAREAVQKWMDGKPLKKFIYVKDKLVSVVV